jgi:hypothetical protein
MVLLQILPLMVAAQVAVAVVAVLVHFQGVHLPQTKVTLEEQKQETILLMGVAAAVVAQKEKIQEIVLAELVMAETVALG